MKTKPEVFILESLSVEDEDKKLFEGRIISDILALSGKRCQYYYIRTKRELLHVLRLFTDSTYRYLHLSCHGNQRIMSTTLDPISFADCAMIFRPHIRNRRLFVSACSMANDSLAKSLMPDSGCYSIIGPDQKILFGDAAILWASLYHVMFACDFSAMTGSVLRAKAQTFANIYQVRLNYFGRDRGSDRGYVSKKIVPR